MHPLKTNKKKPVERGDKQGFAMILRHFLLSQGVCVCVCVTVKLEFWSRANGKCAACWVG